MADNAPNFFIVGAPKSGTSAMFRYLRAHPDVFMPDFKEPHFFGRDLTFRRHPRVSLLEDYLALFAPAEHERLRGEASVWYLYSRTAPGEIKAFCPAAKIIIMLRNPIDMMHSLHSHLLYRGVETIADFAAALDAESRRRLGLDVPAGADFDAELRYRQLACYAPYVQRYLEVFPRDQVHLILYDDFRSQPAASYRRTLRFLGVDDGFRPAFQVVNANKRSRIRILGAPPYGLLRLAKRVLPPEVRRGLKRSVRRINTVRAPRPDMDPALRRRLQAAVTPEVEDLERLIAVDLPQWKADGSTLVQAPRPLTGRNAIEHRDRRSSTSPSQT